MSKLLRSLMHEDTGATAVEYGLMVALIAVVIITSVTLLGVNVRDLFEDVALSQALGGS
jgi:pilus assembly protein Flp/PilA